MKNGFLTASIFNKLTRTMVIGVALATSATALAGQINYDFRADYSSQSFTSDAIPSNSRYVLRTGRIDYKGTLNESLTYEARLAFNKSAGASNQVRDAVSNAVELAFISHKISDMFVLHAGKFNTEIGGFEGASSGADLYLTSPMYTHTGASGLVTTGTAPGTLAGANYPTNGGSPNLLYMTGAKATIGLGETQTLSLVSTNNTTDAADAAGNFNQNRGLMGAVYKGAFFDKTLMALVSYHEVSPEGTGVFHDKQSFIAAGLKYDSQPFAATLEYLTAEAKQDQTGNKDNLNVILGKIGYTIDQWTPRLEAYTADEIRGITVSETNHFLGLGAVLEWKPTADNFRYHIAYTSVTNKPNTGSDSTRGEIMVGARLFGDFLK